MEQICVIVWPLTHMNWYYEIKGTRHGPCTEEQMAELVLSAKLTAETLVWHPKLQNWAPAQELKPKWLELQATPASPPPPAPTAVPAEAESEPPPSPAPVRGVATAAAPKPTPTRITTAPTKKPAAVKEEPKPGLFKRLFGSKDKGKK
jgi:hypothetical protein